MAKRGRPPKSETLYTRYENTLSYAKIKKDLLSQIEYNGSTQEYYLDLVNDYMDWWVIKELLQDDIKERGVSVKWENGKSQKGYKKNESITELSRVNDRMMSILTKLNLQATDTPVGENGEEQEL